MRKADAPPPGWYPDPTGRTQLRWWDGLDWTDHRRAPPSNALLVAMAEAEAVERPRATDEESRRQPWERGTGAAPRVRDETAEIMAEVRKAARDEVDRAMSTLSARARDATSRIEPLISQYGDRVLRGLRTAGIVAVAIVVLWILVQTFAQASLLDWIGDRVDNLFDN